MPVNAIRKLIKVYKYFTNTTTKHDAVCDDVTNLVLQNLKLSETYKNATLEYTREYLEKTHELTETAESNRDYLQRSKQLMQTFQNETMGYQQQYEQECKELNETYSNRRKKMEFQPIIIDGETESSDVVQKSFELNEIFKNPEISSRGYKKLNLDKDEDVVLVVESRDQVDYKRVTSMLGDSVDFINSRNSSDDTEMQMYDEITNVCICMIDIVGFSSWCSNHLPQIIAYAMINYNTIICDVIKKYSSLKKIELVGDSCMIQSVSSNDSYEFGKVCTQTILFANDILCQLDDIKRIFKSEDIGLRIGVHLGDVIGLYIKSPQKYQLFSNDINICSRLEASAIKNAIHVSERLFFVASHCNSESNNLTDKFHISSKIKDEYKGVGIKCSYMLRLKKHEILLMDFDYIGNIERLLPKSCAHNFESRNIALDQYFSYSYIFVCLNLVEDCMTDYEIDKLILRWSSRKKCNIEVILCYNFYQYNYLTSKRLLRFDGIYNVNSKGFKRQMKNLYNSFKQ